MFVRFRKTARRLQLSLVETRRVHGKVQHRHVASLGSIARLPSVDERVEFWSGLPERLAKVSVPIDTVTRILDTIAARVPRLKRYEQQRHHVDNPPIDDEKPTITVPGAPDFSPHFEKLLKAAKAESTPASRTALNSSLQQAWGYFQCERRQQRSEATPELLTQLKDSIRKTLALLAKIGKCQEWEDVGFDHCPIDDVTISIAKFPNAVALPRNPPPLGRLPESVPPHEFRAGVNRKRMLDRLLREIDHLHRKRKKGHQKERDKAAVVAQAGFFFRQFSPAKPTSYFDGPFAIFCKRFYAVVTDKPLTGSSLDKAIREEVKNPAIATQILQEG
jgi:hypothetical protein